MVTLVVTVLTLPQSDRIVVIGSYKEDSDPTVTTEVTELDISSVKKSALSQFFRLSPVRLPCAAVLVMATGSLLKRPKTRFTPK